MKSLEDKMEIHWNLALPIIRELSDNHKDQDKAIFEYGWNACAKEYENKIARCKEIAERDGKDYLDLKHQLEIAKKALQEIKIKPHIAKLYNIEIYRCPTCDSAEIAAEALKEIESAGE